MVMRTWTQSSRLWKSIMDNMSHFKPDNNIIELFWLESVLLCFYWKPSSLKCPKHGVSSTQKHNPVCASAVLGKKHPSSPERLCLSTWSIHSRVRWLKLIKEHQTQLCFTWCARMYGRPASCLAITASTGYPFLFNYDKAIFLKPYLLEQNACCVQSEGDVLIIWSIWRLMLFVLSSFSYNFCRRQIEPQTCFHEWVLCKTTALTASNLGRSFPAGSSY